LVSIVESVDQSIDASLQLGWVEDLIGSLQVSLDTRRELGRSQESLERSLGRIVAPLHFPSHSFLGHQLHHWLEEVHVEAIGTTVEGLDEDLFFLAVVAQVTQGLAHVGPIFTLDVGIVVLVIGAGTGEGKPLPLTVAVKEMIDELAAVVAVDPMPKEGGSPPDGLDGREDSLLTLATDCFSLPPARGDLHCAEGIEEVPGGRGTTVLDQVYFQEAELSGFPAIQLDGDLLVKERTGTRETPLALQMKDFSWVAQLAVDGGRSDALQLRSDGIGDEQLAEGPQSIHLTDQKRLQPPSAGVVEDLPGLSQSSHHLAVVEGLAFLPLLCPQGRARMDLADSVLAILTGVGAVLVEDPGLLRATAGVEIPLAQSIHVLIAGMHIHLLGLAPLGDVFGDILVDATEPAWVTY